MTKKPPDNLQGTYDKRVFIGGNYDAPILSVLRKIKKVVRQCGFTPILPYDDLDLPIDQIYDWDLRTLHNCKYAIFDVSNPAGELFEIARCHEYKTNTLFVFGTRESEKERKESEEFPRVNTMLKQCGHHVSKSYADLDNDLPPIVQEFLLEKNRLLFEQATDIYGFKFEIISDSYIVNSDGSAKQKRTYKGLKATSNRMITQVYHEFLYSPSVMIEFSPKYDSKRLDWKEEKEITGTSHDGKTGTIMIIGEGLKQDDSPVNYEFEIETQGTFFLRKSDIPASVDDEILVSGYDYISLNITYPTELLKLRVNFEDYNFKPEYTAYHGKVDQRAEAIKIPPDKFSIFKNTATLEVVRPLIFHKYYIIWPIQD